MTPNNRPENPEQSPLLRQWLHTATRSLCPAAAERIGREIGEHFVATVDALVAGGASAADAERSALRGLGSPRAARRRLHKTDLTGTEARMLSQLLKRPVMGVPYVNTGVAIVRYFSYLLQLPLVMAITYHLYIAQRIEVEAMGLLGLIGVTLLMTLSIEVPSWLCRGMHAREIDAVVIAKLRQVANLRAMLCCAAFVIMFATTTTHFLTRESRGGAESRQNADYVQISVCCMALVIAGSAVQTFRALRKLSKHEGPVQS